MQQLQRTPGFLTCVRDEEAEAHRSFKTSVCLTSNAGLLPPFARFVLFTINRISLEFTEQGQRRSFYRPFTGGRS